MSLPAPQQGHPSSADGYQGYEQQRQPVTGPSNYGRQTYIPVSSGYATYSPNQAGNGSQPAPILTQPTIPPQPHTFQRSYQSQQTAYMHPYAPDIHQGMPSYSYGADVAPNYQFGSVPAVPQPFLPQQSTQPMTAHAGDIMPFGDDGSKDGDNALNTVEGLQVKHRRRTTPEQLKVLEFWYDINPKPDNQLREQLAAQLGMTKRNVQVWFQNRRAKMKGLAKKEAEEKESMRSPENTEGTEGSSSATDPSLTPLTDSAVPSSHFNLLAPPTSVNMGRRASLANGEAAKIEIFVAKRAAAQKREEVLYNAGGYSAPPGTRSPVLGQAYAARRGSIPYPTPQMSGPPASTSPLSPKFSAACRGPSTLHMAAVRNNTRRPSIPGAAQLISSGPFTPPRVVSNQHQTAAQNKGTRELSPIQDHEVYNTYGGEYQPWSGDLPPSMYLPPAEGFHDGRPFSHDSPLPNPAFSFGCAPQGLDAQEIMSIGQMDEKQQQMYMMMQQRDRLGSIASIGTMGTESGTEGGESASGEWLVDGPEGFDPDARRASAPPDLLHQIGLMGFATLPSGAPAPAPIRPSPLNAHFTPDSFQSTSPYYPPSTSSSSTYSFPLHPSSDSISNDSPTAAHFERLKPESRGEEPQQSQPQSQQQTPLAQNHVNPGPGNRMPSYTSTTDSQSPNNDVSQYNNNSMPYTGYQDGWNPSTQQQPFQQQHLTQTGQPASSIGAGAGAGLSIGLGHPSNSHLGHHQEPNQAQELQAAVSADEKTPTAEHAPRTLGHPGSNTDSLSSGGKKGGAKGGNEEGKDEFSYFSEFGGHDAVNVLV